MSPQKNLWRCKEQNSPCLQGITGLAQGLDGGSWPLVTVCVEPSGWSLDTPERKGCLQKMVQENGGQEKTFKYLFGASSLPLEAVFSYSKTTVRLPLYMPADKLYQSVARQMEKETQKLSLKKGTC